MWRRILRRQAEAAPVSEKVDNAASEEEAAALAALAEWEAAISAGRQPARNRSVTSATSCDSHLVPLSRHILGVPRGPSRDALVDRLRDNLQRTLLSGTAAEWLQSHLSILRESAGSKELGDAVGGSLAAMQTDPQLERCDAVAASCEQLRAKAATGEAAVATELATVLQEARALREAGGRCQELVRSRRFALHQAEMLLSGPRRDAEGRAEKATEEQMRFREELESLGRRAGSELVGSLEEEGTTLESEVNRLTGRKRQIKAELDELSRQKDDAISRQKAHMLQVDCWRLDKEKVKETSQKAKEEKTQKVAVANKEQSRCAVFLESLQHAQEGLRSCAAGARRDGDALIVRGDEDIRESASEVVLAAEARLEQSIEAAVKAHGDHKRAKSTLELLEVEAPQSDLPTRHELTRVLETLRDAWAARATLGSVELKRRAEVESLLREASDSTSDDTLADAKATWAKHWSEMEDLASTLADAAAGQSGGSSATDTVFAGVPGVRQEVLAPPSRQGLAGRGGRVPVPSFPIPTLDDDEPLLAMGT